MKAKIIFLLLLISVSAFSQIFNTGAEARYLQIVNAQNRKDLIKDNIRNAELIADSLFFYTTAPGKFDADFLAMLAQSYFLLKDYQGTFFTILRQRTLFPSSKYENFLYTLFLTSSKHLKIDKKTADKIWLETSKEKISKLGDKERKILLLKLALTSPDRKLFGKAFHYLTLFEFQPAENQLPFWIAQWKLLYSLKFSPRKTLQLIDFQNTTDNYNFPDDIINSFPANFQKRVKRRIKFCKIFNF